MPLKSLEENVYRTSFWGIRCESGKKYTQVVTHRFHISMAALDPTVVSTSPCVSLMVERGGSQYLLCNLVPKSVLQANLDLYFEKGEKVTFSLKGVGTVHLSGYHIYDENDAEPSVNSNLKIISTKEETGNKKNENKQLKKKITAQVKANAKLPAQENSDENDSSEDDSDEDFEIEIPKGKNLPKKRAIAEMDDSDEIILDEDSEDEDDNDFYCDDDESDMSSDESELGKKVPEQKKMLKEFQNKKLKTSASTPLAAKKDTSKKVKDSEHNISQSREQTKPGEMDSSIARTPMPKKPVSVLKHSKSNNSPMTLNITSKSDNISNALNTTDATSSKKKKKKKKKSSDQLDQSSTLESSKLSETNKTPSKADESISSTPQYSKKLQGGIEYDDIRVGHGPPAMKGKLVHVYYTGKLDNNKVFDSCGPGSKAFSFKLGTGQVIKGWDLGLEGMKVGGKRRIKVPANFAYGNKRTGPIPPNSTLHFTIELKAVS